MNQPTPNPNCGGGVDMFIQNKFSYEVLSLDSSVIPGVYESMWVQIEVSKGNHKIIGNVYRPNSAPWADLGRAISNHKLIIDSIKANKIHKNCEIQVLSDFNINLLNFAQHDLTNIYLESIFFLWSLTCYNKTYPHTPHVCNLN